MVHTYQHPRPALTVDCVVFGLDDGTLVGLACSSEGLASKGWPKYMGSAGQSGGSPLS